MYDASNYNASFDDLKKDAKELVKDHKKMSEELLKYVNEYRVENKLEKLILDENINLAATIKAIDYGYTYINRTLISNRMRNVLSSFEILNRLEFPNKVSENIRVGKVSSKEIVDSWKKIEKDNKNMLNSDKKIAGVGYFEFNNTIYWVLLLVD